MILCISLSIVLFMKPTLYALFFHLIYWLNIKFSFFFRNVMSSQDVVTFVRERLKAGVDKLSSICEEV